MESRQTEHKLLTRKLCSNEWKCSHRHNPFEFKVKRRVEREKSLKIEKKYLDLYQTITIHKEQSRIEQIFSHLH